MMRIARSVFPKALITNDRFHVQKLYYDALDDMRIAYRWMARDKGKALPEFGVIVFNI